MLDLNPYYSKLDSCLNLDAINIRRRLSGLQKVKDETKQQSILADIDELISTSSEKLEDRRSRELAFEFPPQLPISEHVDEIVESLNNNQVIVVAGETGSGKTTQLPKICLKAGLGTKGLIGHTQPRRLAARTVSSRIAEELNTSLGDVVGYQVRFTDQVSDQSAIKLMTDGILLSEIKRDRFLHRYDAIIIDEAHERSLNIDFLLGYLKFVLKKRPELKLIITSATIDVERFSKHFNDAPIFSVSGRTYPVDVFYREPTSDDEYDKNLFEHIADTVEEIALEERKRDWPVGDILVFLPGEREIRECSKHLKYCEFDRTEILPLYARLHNKEQNRIFASHSGRRIVLSTNVAETSITVPGIRYVIDSGLVRMSRYSYRSKIQRLPIEAISQASANQRAGRCGRVSEGICYRLYSESDFNGRPEFTDPEILRTNLGAVILKMLDSGLGDVHSFPFIDPPEKKLWNDGFKLLDELGAVDRHRKLTALGKKMAIIPTDPKLAKMLLSASDFGCFAEVLVIVSALSIQDPRDRPTEKKQQADQAHAEFKDLDSDFVSFLKLWEFYENNRQELGTNQLKKLCQKHYLSFMRMREWRDIHRQLLLVSKDLGLTKHSAETTVSDKVSEAPNKEKGKQNSANDKAVGRGRDINRNKSKEVEATESRINYQNIHQSLLSGLLNGIGRHDEKREYIGCRNRRFQIFPGSSLTKSKPKWLVSAELVETQQLYARMNARIDPEWIEPLASHLVKKSWSEPHWEKRRAQVVAYERVSLYGLDIVAKRRVNYGVINPVESREIFIRTGLIEGEYQNNRIKALSANRALIKDLEDLENRTRRRDILVDDDSIYDLYDAVIPSHIVSGASFEKWCKGLTEDDAACLRFTRDQFARKDTDLVDESLFPNHIENNGIRLPLSYQFKPGEDDDGLSISVPLQAVKQLSTSKLERLVPGMLKEKCTHLIRNLPRTLRRHFVPVPDTVEAVLPRIENSEDDLITSLTHELKRRTQIQIPIESWDLAALEDYLKLNIKVVDDKGKTIEQGRDLSQLIDKLDAKIDQAIHQDENQPFKSKIVKDWNFGELKNEHFVKRAGIELKLYPALKDLGTGVELLEASNDLQAREWTRLGLARLISFQIQDQISMLPKLLPDYKKLGLYYAPVGQAKNLYDDFTIACIVNLFNTDTDLNERVSTKSEFNELFQSKRGEFVEFAQSFSQTVLAILEKYHRAMKLLKGKISNLALAMPMSDLQAQLGDLIYDGFLSKTPYEQLQHFPRYLEAAEIRFEKMARNTADERKYVGLLNAWREAYNERFKILNSQGIHDPELEKFRWLLEEIRVSWFAQKLGTTKTVSEKRLNKQWELVRRP